MIAILLRDLKLALRSGGGFGLGVAFFLILVTMVPFAVGADPAVLSRIAPGMLWIGALLSCLLTLDRIFALDWEDGTLELLATAPVPLEGVAATKALAHWISACVPLILVTPVFAIMLNMTPNTIGPMVLSLLLGTPALSVIGAFGAGLSVGVKRGGLLLSLLVLPLYIPTLIFGAQVAARAGLGQSYETPLILLTGVTFAASALLPFATAAVLRINIR